MDNIDNDVNIYHRFIQMCDKKPAQSQCIPQFGFMEQSIRKSFRQLKKNHKLSKPSEEFAHFWKDLSRQEQVELYFKWTESLLHAVQGKNDLNFEKKTGQIYVRKSYLRPWEKKQTQLKGPFVIIKGKKHTYELKLSNYEIRKSKNKEHFGWVLQVITRNGGHPKSCHFGTNNSKVYTQWYTMISKNISIARRERLNEKMGQKNNGRQEKQPLGDPLFKTITETVIDNQMKNLNSVKYQQVMLQHQQQQEIIPDNQLANNHIEQDNQKIQCLQKHPNIHRKLLPFRNITNFHNVGSNCTLIEMQKQFGIYETPNPNCQERPFLKLIGIIPFPRSSVFILLSACVNLWNDDIDVFSVKTKISSENSALIYEKHRSQGFLYRQRDFLYLRHCFSKKEGQDTLNFIIDKSIDSLNYPPFMTVTRGDKELIWCVMDKQDNQSTVIIEGLVSGGGYMKYLQDRDMTIRFFKKIFLLEAHLKLNETLNNLQSNLFREQWEVEKDEQLYLQSSTKLEHQVEPEKQKEFDQFVKQTSQEFMDCQSQSFCSQQKQLYTPPLIGPDRKVIIPTKYLTVKHQKYPKQKPNKPCYSPQVKGHHLWKGEWAVRGSGGLNYVDQDKMSQQKKVLTFIIKKIGKNIFSGKGILNICLPVDIFSRESNIQRLAMSFGYAPIFLQKAAHIQDPSEQIKHVICSGITSSLIYISMDKPFNPILGQTYQGWLDECPVYFQQISHHPPIAAFLMIGRGYRISGTLEAKMELSINSGTGSNQGIFKVDFDNGNTFYFTTATGELSGLTYGQRHLLFVGKTYYWSLQHGFFCQLQFNLAAKNRKFFGSSNLVGEEKFNDYFEGTVKAYNKSDLQEFLAPKRSNTIKETNFPRSAPPFQHLHDLFQVNGRWTKHITINGVRMVDIDECRYLSTREEEFPLPSQSSLREDLVYRRMNDFVLSQQFKENLELAQRQDRKMRQKNAKNRK